MVKLRPYQQQAVDSVFAEWQAGHDKTMVVQATGTGKTIVFSEITRRLADQDKRVLILAHRGELLEQAQDKLLKSTGLVAELEKAEHSAAGSNIVVGSVQTMQGNRLESWPATYFDTVIIDECHHCTSTTYRNVLSHFDSAQVLGVTATADRADRRNLGEVFDSIAFEYNIAQAVRDGYLVPLKAKSIPLQIDLSQVSVTAGDYNAAQAGAALEPYLEEIAKQMAIHCKGRKIMVFLPLVKMSQDFARLLNRNGFHAAEVNGQSKDRAEIITDFTDGRYDVLCNSMLLTEGFDCPAVDCIVCLRPTKSRALYTQIVGRGTRPSPETGKKDLLILDFLWLTDRHELCRPAHLICKDADVADRVKDKLEADQGILDLMKLEAQAESEILEQRKAALANELEKQRKKRVRLVDPLQFEMSIMDEDLVSYEPVFAWEMKEPTVRQAERLEKAGINADGLCRGKVAQILDRLSKRNSAGMSTPKQIRFLERYGFIDVGKWTKHDASELIGRISSNKWKVPAGIVPSDYKPGEKRKGNNTWNSWKS